MPIHWFPGHMNATRQAIKDRVKAGLDVVIELLDARLPGSSSNPLLAALTTGRPSLKVLNKQDLADPAMTARWLEHYDAQAHTRAIALDAGEKAPARALVKACRELAPHRGGLDKPMRVLICGIPNVGKSTLINTLVGRRAAKTGDEPGITKVEQKIVLEDGFYLFDTPGMLWPRISVTQSGYHLAASGAIGRNAFDEEEVALELIAVLRRHYPERLKERFGLAELGTDDAVLEAIGLKRGAKVRGGGVQMHKAAEALLADFRQGLLGRITLETPEEMTAWRQAAAEEEAREAAEREAERAADKERRSGRRAASSGDA
ncbi:MULTISPECIES: ribosome biogenesis GTPase YlqF [Roseateles]|uniref:Ribosome biogenesis GTPase A n=1 Tax=Pelomonas caseinilytica TaxID=2906763 RepID=A0ABS8XGY9_9BURK|nr:MULTISPECIES: ribosome biogenesis GTPase YlqF [unclassified Roseateles]MCE4537824.1 ribosome biogenesis GTPase YlqF [Pelomonas sp. P7]HEV6964039.1 ribosome biogenesis GTPase YlqF [Roseateles sp.]